VSVSCPLSFKLDITPRVKLQLERTVLDPAAAVGIRKHQHYNKKDTTANG